MDEQKGSDPNEPEDGGRQGSPGPTPRHDGPDGHGGHGGHDHRAYAFRPGEVLIVAADVPLLGGAEGLAQRSGLRRPTSPERYTRDETIEALGIQRWLTATEDADVVAIVEDLRTPVEGEPKHGHDIPEVVPRVFLD